MHTPLKPNARGRKALPLPHRHRSAARAVQLSVPAASRSFKRSHFWQAEETIAPMTGAIENVFPWLHNFVHVENFLIGTLLSISIGFFGGLILMQVPFGTLRLK